MKRSGFLMRVLATVIDLMIVAIACTIASLVLDLSERESQIVFSGGWLAYTTFEFWTAGTPGKLMLGRTIANLDGSAASGSTLFFRWSTKQFPFIAFLLFDLTQS